MSWLSSLASHPIFRLPLDSSPSSSASVHPSTPSTSLARSSAIPPHSSSTSLARIFPPSSTPSKPSPLHPTTPSSSSSSRTNTPRKNNATRHQQQVQEIEQLEKGQGGKKRQKMCLLGGGDWLLVAVGMELRCCSLKQIKSSQSNSKRGDDNEFVGGDYKVKLSLHP